VPNEAFSKVAVIKPQSGLHGVDRLQDFLVLPSAANDCNWRLWLGCNSFVRWLDLDGASAGMKLVSSRWGCFGGTRASCDLDSGPSGGTCRDLLAP
jgi:hypothetical protein